MKAKIIKGIALFSVILCSVILIEVFKASQGTAILMVATTAITYYLIDKQ